MTAVVPGLLTDIGSIFVGTSDRSEKGYFLYTFTDWLIQMNIVYVWHSGKDWKRNYESGALCSLSPANNSNSQTNIAQI